MKHLSTFKIPDQFCGDLRRLCRLRWTQVIMAPSPPKSAELLRKHKHGWKGFKCTFILGDQKKKSSFTLPAVKHGEAASWFRSDWKLEVIYVTIKFVHANLLGKLLLTSIRHTPLQPSTYLTGLLCMCGNLAEVLASECCWTDCCRQRVGKPFKDDRHWQFNLYSSSEGTWTKGSTTVHSHCFFFPLTAYLCLFVPSCFYSQSIIWFRWSNGFDLLLGYVIQGLSPQTERSTKENKQVEKSNSTFREKEHLTWLLSVRVQPGAWCDTHNHQSVGEAPWITV